MMSIMKLILNFFKMSPSYENYVKYGWDINIS